MPCYIQRTKDGGTMFLCGDLGPHCGACASVGDFLCDFPVGEGKTCDMPLCEEHATEVAPNVHYCPGHMVLWQEFRDAGRGIAGIDQLLLTVGLCFGVKSCELGLGHQDFTTHLAGHGILEGQRHVADRPDLRSDVFPNKRVGRESCEILKKAR